MSWLQTPFSCYGSFITILFGFQDSTQQIVLLLVIRSPSSLWFVSFSALAGSPTPISWLRRCLPNAQLLTPVFLQLPDSPPPFLFYAFHMHHHGFFFSFSSPQNKGFCFLFNFVFYLLLLCIFASVCASTYVPCGMCESREQFVGSILFFHHGGPRNWTHVVWLSSKQFHLLSHPDITAEVFSFTTVPGPVYLLHFLPTWILRRSTQYISWPAHFPI